jgi:hypothetical protein
MLLILLLAAEDNRVAWGLPNQELGGDQAPEAWRRRRRFHAPTSRCSSHLAEAGLIFRFGGFVMVNWSNMYNNYQLCKDAPEHYLNIYINILLCDEKM